MGACEEGSCTKSSHGTRRRAISPVGLRLLVCVLTSQVKSRQIKSSQVKSSQIKSSQVKSAPTPAGEPNVRGEAEKKKINIYIYINIYLNI